MSKDGPTKLSPQEIGGAMTGVPDWTLAEDNASISKTFKFKDFSAAWGFMSRCALTAETMGHHPEWFNVYNTVEVTLNTHDVGGLSQLDFEMAQAMDQLAKV